jgi:hypothetical protein
VKKDWDNCGAVGREFLKKSSTVVFLSQEVDSALVKRDQAPPAFAQWPRIIAGCCARAARGHTAAAPPMSLTTQLQVIAADHRLCSQHHAIV